MNLYEWEGKNLFAQFNIATPKGVVVRRGDDFAKAYQALGFSAVAVKAQALVGKRGKHNGIKFCRTEKEAVAAIEALFKSTMAGQPITAVLIEEKLAVAEEQYLSISYDTNRKQPLLIYSEQGGMDIEAAPAGKLHRWWLDIRQEKIDVPAPLAQEVWNCFLLSDARQVEINPLVKTAAGQWVAADAKVALDDDAFFRHKEWEALEPRTMLGRPPTELEQLAKKIDEGENYYRGTAGKYIEMDGDIALILNGGGASIANMDALIKVGLKPANYTEYSGNPPREKVRQLTKIVLSKPGLRGLWMCGVVANFTNMKDTFLGVIEALDEIKPSYPIVVRRDGPESAEAFALMRACAERNNLRILLFDKTTSMSKTAAVLATMVQS